MIKKLKSRADQDVYSKLYISYVLNYVLPTIMTITFYY